MSFTGRFAVQYKIQHCQLRVAHPDDHYCAAILLYIKHLSVVLNTLEAVKCSLICIFKELHLDLLIVGYFSACKFKWNTSKILKKNIDSSFFSFAGRCAPGQSWTNPAERVMSILNLLMAKEYGMPEKRKSR